MRSNYKILGAYIRPVDVRNRDESISLLRGISSVHKELVKSRANMIGVSLRNYKVVAKYQFAFNPNTARMGEKIPVALNLSDSCVVSSIYPVFEIKNTAELEPEYLMMWFRRPEFDRYARFKSHGSAREIFSWEEMCNIELPIPSIEEQKRIVLEYRSIVKRIKVCNALNHKLEDVSQTLYRKYFVDKIDSRGSNWKDTALKFLTTKIGSGSTPRGGKEAYKTKGTSLIRSMNVHDYSFSYENLAHINEDQASKLSNVVVQKNDILLNITGVSVARCCLAPADIIPARVNQHVAIIRPTNSNLSNYLMLALCSSKYKSKLLGSSEAGSTRQALTKSELEDFKIPLPDEASIESFNNSIVPILNLKRQLNHEKIMLRSCLHILLSSLANQTDRHISRRVESAIV